MTPNSIDRGGPIRLVSLSPDAPELPALEAINREAIPESERNSLADLFATGEDGNLDILGIECDGAPAGFMAVRKHRDVRYLAYLAVRRDLRGRGIGSRALQALIEASSGCRVVVEYESPGASGEGQRARRRAFYRRNGFVETGWRTRYDGATFEIACAGLPFDPAAFGEFIDYLNTIVQDHIPRPFRAVDP